MSSRDSTKIYSDAITEALTSLQERFRERFPFMLVSLSKEGMGGDFTKSILALIEEEKSSSYCEGYQFGWRTAGDELRQRITSLIEGMKNKKLPKNWDNLVKNTHINIQNETLDDLLSKIRGEEKVGVSEDEMDAAIGRYVKAKENGTLDRDFPVLNMESGIQEETECCEPHSFGTERFCNDCNHVRDAYCHKPRTEFHQETEVDRLRGQMQIMVGNLVYVNESEIVDTHIKNILAFLRGEPVAKTD